MPVLDRDTARRIVGCLDMSDVISMSQTCRSFWELSCGASRLHCSLSSAPRPEEAEVSFTRFIKRKCSHGMEVSFYSHEHDLPALTFYYQDTRCASRLATLSCSS